MTNLETILNQIAALKTREAQVRALLRAAEEKSHQHDSEVRTALAALRQDLATSRSVKADPAIDHTLLYQQMIDKIRAFVNTTLPRAAKVLVISRGDNALLQLAGREGWHFPQSEGGGYAGHYPADGKAAVEHLEALRTRGADYLLIPATATWWLTHYVDFHRRLESRYLRVHSDENCTLYGLSEARVQSEGPPAAAGAPKAPAPGAAREIATNGHPKRNGAAHPPTSYARLVDQIRAAIDQALPEDATVLIVSKGDEDLVQLAGRRGWHYPQTEDGTYAGHYPADGAAAVEHLETLRRKGAAYLVFPRTAFWWLVHYEDLRRHLDARCRRIHSDGACVIYALGSRGMVGRLMRRFSFGLADGR